MHHSEPGWDGSPWIRETESQPSLLIQGLQGAHLGSFPKPTPPLPSPHAHPREHGDRRWVAAALAPAKGGLGEEMKRRGPGSPGRELSSTCRETLALSAFSSWCCSEGHRKREGEA